MTKYQTDYNYRREGEWFNKMAGTVDKLYKGAVSKLFFPNIKKRMKTRIPISAEFTAIVAGHGLTRSYCHRLKFIPSSTCPCRIKEEQPINHTIMNCIKLENERRILQNAIVRTGDTWPPPFEQLTRKHIKTSAKFAKSIDFSTL
jgi:hypothetical protein